MSDFFNWYDGDTHYDTQRQGTRLAGANAAEAKTASGDYARAASQLATDRGYRPTEVVETDKYGREVRQFASPEGDGTLAQALVNGGFATPTGGEFSRGTSFTGRAARELLGQPAEGLEADAGFQYLAERARESRLQAIDQSISSGRLPAQIGALPEIEDPREARGVVDRAWDRGVDNLQGTLYGFSSALGHLTGADLLAEYGDEGMAQNIWEAMASPATVKDYEDIDGLADAGIYALEALVEFSPQLGVDALAALGSGGAAVVGRHALAAAGKSVLRRFGGSMAAAVPRKVGAYGFQQAAKAGALGSIYAQTSGETQMELTREGIDAPETALLVGGAKAALEYAGLTSIFKGVAGRFAAGAEKTPGRMAELLGSALAATGRGVATESTTEMAQTLFDELAKQGHKPEYQIDTEAIIDAGIKGGIVGGGLQGGGTLAADTVRMASTGYKAGIPGANDPAQDTAREPLADIEAQLAATPSGEGNWYTRENAEQAKQVAAVQGKPVRELADGSVVVAAEEVLAGLPAEPTQADLARLNGYTQTKDEALADPAGTAAVNVRDANGAVLRNQLVGASVAEATRAAMQQKFPNATVEITTPEAVVAQRAVTVAQEQAKPGWQPKGLLAEGDVTGWVNRAVELGIDPLRFQKTGLGDAVVSRARTGLQAQVPGNRERRLDSLEALAGVLDLPAQELRREYYDSRNVIKGRDLLHQAFTARVAERFGSPAEFAKAVDNLPAPEARAIQQALGVKEEGGYDLGALRSEIVARDSNPAAARPTPEVDLDSTETEAAPARQAVPDKMRDAVFNTPLLRQLLTTPAGKTANAVQIDDAIDALSPGERLRLEETLTAMDIDVGGQNREAFLQLLEDSVVGPTTYGVGRQLENEDDAESGYRAVPTVEQQPALLDSADAGFVSSVRGTRLTDRDRSGGQVGLSTYLLALSKIIRAGEPEQQSALSAAEATALNHARVLGGVIEAALRMDPRIERAPLHEAVAQALGVDEALLGKAAGRELAVAPAMAQLATGVDQRAARGLLLMLSRQNDLDGDQQNLDATLTALASNPEGAVRGLVDSLQQLYGHQVIEDVGLISFYERNEGGRRDEAFREDGTPRRPAFERGGDHTLNAVNLPENEQAASDDQFFGRMAASSIKGWRLAVMPSAEQLAELLFDNALAQQVTQRFQGANLLALPQFDGTLYGRVIDAVSLARYAQSGEHAPGNAAEAASNLLDNLSRLMAGAQNAHDTQPGVAKAVVRTIPDSLVIFIDPVTGNGVTFGEALNSRRAGEHAHLRQSAVQRELDDVTDAIDRLADPLAELAADLENRAPDYATHPTVRRAVDLWRRMIGGETELREGRRVHVRKPAREGADKPLRAAVDAIGKLKVGDETLDQAFGRYLGLLSQRKRLAQESATLSADGARREAPSEEQIVAGKLGVDYDTASGRRQVEEALRGGQRTAVIAEEVDSVDSLGDDSPRDAVDPEFNAYAHDPLSRFSDTAWMDADDIAQEAAIAAWLASQSKAGIAPGLAATGRQATAHPGSVAKRVELPPLFRLASTVTGEKPAQGMSLADVEQVVAAFTAAYNGHIPLLFRIAQTQEEVYGPAPTGEDGNPVVVKGAYHPRGRSAAERGLGHQHGAVGAAADVQPGMAPGRLVLIADNLRDEADVLETLRHEVFGHFGLNTFPPAVKKQILDVIRASRGVAGLQRIWADIDRRYADMTESVRAEEVFAFVAEQERVGLAKVYDQVLAWLTNAARQVGLLKGRVTRAELAVMAGQIAEGIRAGTRRQRTFPQTDSEQFRRGLPTNGVLQARGKQFWEKGVVPKLAPAFSMVYSRIARYSPELSRLLFQPAGAQNAVIGQSWEQRSRALKGRMMAQVDHLLTELHQGAPKRKVERDLAIQSAFEDAYSGQPQTATGRRIRQLVDNLVLEAERAGLQSVALGKGFAPIAFDRQAVAARQGDFEKLVADKLKLPPREVRELVDRILNGPGTLEGVITPGLPVGAHQTTRELAEAIGQDQLLQDGWLLRRHDAALFHWVDGMAKRAAWEGIFGARDGQFVERNGRIEQAFNPNAKFQALVAQVRSEQGEQAAQEIHALVNGALGRHPAGQSMPGWWRSTQEFITGWVGMTVLAFSGIASIPELALPLVRAGGRVGLSDLFNDLGDARRFARDMGIVLSDASEQVMWQMTGEQYQSPAISKMQRWFFRLNGNELIVRTSRTLATGIGIRYLLNAAADGDHAALGRLNIDAGTVHAWDQTGRPTWSPELDPALQGVAAKVSDAVNQFVNEATLNPSRFQATHWGNNPYLKMIWHLKHFLYTYGDTVLGGMYREMRRRWSHLDPKQFGQAVAIAMPALVFAVAVLPLAAASLEGRDWVRRLNGRPGEEYEGALDYFSAVFSRAGGLGPLEFLANLRQQQEWGMSVWGSLSPTAGKVDMIFGEQAAADKLRGLIPIWSQNKTLMGLLE